MNAILLCAGFATRMYPLTQHFPKPLLQVGGRPVLDYLVEQILEIPEIEAIHVVSNDKFFRHFEQWGRTLQVEGAFGRTALHIHNDGSRDNETRRGAAADLLFALEKVGNQGRILAAGGDNIFRFSLMPLWREFRAREDHAVAALVETEKEKLCKTGVLELDAENRVLRLHEKPREPKSTWVSPPLYFFMPSVRDVLQRFLETPGNHDAPGYFIDYLSRNERVQAIKVRAGRLDIGCLKTYHEADRLLAGSSDNLNP